MKLRKKKQFVISAYLIGIFVSFSFFLIGYKNYLNPKLGSFKISSIKEVDSILYMDVTPSHNAVAYKVVGYDNKENVVYEHVSESNVISLQDFYVANDENLEFNVYAYNKNDIELEADNSYNYITKDLSISNSNEHYSVKGKDFVVLLDGQISEDKYTLDVYYDDVILKTFDILNNQVVLDNELLDSLSGKVVLKLKKNDKRVTSIFTLYANSPVVGNISIKNSEDISYVAWDDLKINFNGGVNATNIIVNISRNGKIEKTLTRVNNTDTITIPAKYFKEKTKYKIELIAVYKDYIELAKTAEVEVNFLEKETVDPVYINYNYLNMKKGTKITLASNTAGAKIYYTLDGSEPTVNSFLYKEGITINGDVTIKAKAVKNNMYDSVVNTYPIHIGEKQLVVYLSPSNQYENYGAYDSGYTTEKAMMNKLADYLQPYLESFGVKVYRNNPNGDINSWLSESNYVKSDLHLALHSNASAEHNAYGIEMYVDNATSKSLSIANKIYHNLYKIYPYKNKFSNRGVKYSDKSLGEANDLFIPFGTLIEIAYHDYYNDARWMALNLEEIAKNIGDSIIEYYQVK